MYTLVMCVKTLFPAMFAVINGIAKAVENVKEVMPQASSPGYILMTAAISFLPAFMLILAMLSQIMGQPVMSLALVMLTISVAAAGWKGYVMTRTDSKKSIKKNFKAAHEKTKKAKTASMVILAAWGGFMAYRIHAGAPGTEEIMEQFENIDMRAMIKDLPMMILGAGSKFVMFKCLTYTMFTDILMVSVFDAADELQAKDGEVDEDKMDLLKDWQKIMPPKKNK